VSFTYGSLMAQPFVEPCSRGIIAAQPFHAN